MSNKINSTTGSTPELVNYRITVHYLTFNVRYKGTQIVKTQVILSLKIAYFLQYIGMQMTMVGSSIGSRTVVLIKSFHSTDSE